MPGLKNIVNLLLYYPFFYYYHYYYYYYSYLCNPNKGNGCKNALHNILIESTITFVSLIIP